MTDPAAATLTVIDDGHGMRRRELARYHDIAATTKIRGQGIGFAGVGIKLGLLVSEEVVTETRRGAVHVATTWGLTSRQRAPWRWIPPPGPRRPTGNRRPAPAPEPALAPPRPRLRRGHALPALPAAPRSRLRPDPGRALSARSRPRAERHPARAGGLARGGVRARRGPPGAEAEAVRGGLPRPRPRAPAGRPTRPGDQHVRQGDQAGLGLARVDTGGARPHRGPDRGPRPRRVPRPSTRPTSSASAPAARCTSRTGRRSRKRSRPSSRPGATSRTPGDNERRRAARPVERDLESVLGQLAEDFPLLASLVERRAGGQRRLPMGRPGTALAASDVPAPLTLRCTGRRRSPKRRRRPPARRASPAHPPPIQTLRALHRHAPTEDGAAPAPAPTRNAPVRARAPPAGALRAEPPVCPASRRPGAGPARRVHRVDQRGSSRVPPRRGLTLRGLPHRGRRRARSRAPRGGAREGARLPDRLPLGLGGGHDSPEERARDENRRVK